MFLGCLEKVKIFAKNRKKVKNNPVFENRTENRSRRAVSSYFRANGPSVHHLLILRSYWAFI